MKASRIVNNIIRKIQVNKIERREAEIRKYLSFECINNPTIKNELYDAREILANYAKANNVRVTMIEPWRKDYINISVAPLNSFDAVRKNVPATKESINTTFFFSHLINLFFIEG